MDVRAHEAPPRDRGGVVLRLDELDDLRRAAAAGRTASPDDVTDDVTGETSPTRVADDLMKRRV